MTSYYPTMDDARLKANYNDIYHAIHPSNFTGKLKGKVVLVTGAGRGIGRATAVAFAKAGADVACTSRTKAELEETAKLCEAEGVKALVCPADATNEEAVEQVVKTVEAKLGPIEILVNNAGVNRLRPFRMTAWKEWWSVVDINLKSPMHLVSLVLPGMIKRKSGTIVNVASRAGVQSRPFASSYTTSKTGLIRATACIQTELDMDADGVSPVALFSLHPGGPKTKMNEGLVEPDVDAEYPGMAGRVQAFVDIQKDTVDLCAGTCVFLAADPRSRGMRGRYFDVEQDVEAVCEHAQEVVEMGGHDLKLDMIGGWEPEQPLPERH